MMVVQNLHATDFKNFLILNGIKDKQIPKGYPQEHGKVEAYNKIVIARISTNRRIER